MEEMFHGDDGYRDRHPWGVNKRAPTEGPLELFFRISKKDPTNEDSIDTPSEAAWDEW